ncbi:uncharacterized protein CC84DRAFT_619848 [Paraphaeosphaeria sporulosa]|uniref:Uncharacterized protein n=1 Tax=Paraphaeosphaeria sporulosa TaxID=1460663 RepID=A0A177CHC1_9PLEO|nr:uncharacterized protein CC84DRAFT_619848 [Paraphaeosphaeria sporulosa]OAG06726.1 hypothetical protein CC84DRAFT_619848 [Paraphaeosphaeria sporulosa]
MKSPCNTVSYRYSALCPHRSTGLPQARSDVLHGCRPRQTHGRDSVHHLPVEAESYQRLSPTCMVSASTSAGAGLACHTQYQFRTGTAASHKLRPDLEQRCLVATASMERVIAMRSCTRASDQIITLLWYNRAAIRRANGAGARHRVLGGPAVREGAGHRIARQS